MGCVLPFAVRFAFITARDGAFFPFFPVLGFVFFGLLADTFFTFLMAPGAALLAAFFGVPPDFFFFFFKVCSFRVVTPWKSSILIKLLRARSYAERKELTDARTSSIAGSRASQPDWQILDRCESYLLYILLAQTSSTIQ